MCMKRMITILCLGVVAAGAGLGIGEFYEAAPELDGQGVIEATMAAYRQAPALTDTIHIEVEQPGGKVEDEMQVMLAASGDAELHMQGFVFTAIGPKLFVHQEKLPTKYVEMPMEGNVLETLKSVTGGRAAFPAPSLHLRFADSPEDAIDAFGLGLAGGLTLTGHDTMNEGGRAFDQLQFEAANNDQITARIDGRTRLIDWIELKRAATTYTFTMHPERHEALPEAIVFDPSGRRKVEGLAQLSLGEGDPAPDFTLPGLDGRAVKLSDLRGNVVVLDFWATWCGPCKRGLPELQKFADWAGEQGYAVKVYPVNIGERQPTQQSKHQVVSKFWEGSGFRMTTLMDYEDAMARAYQVGPIPHTVVVGPDGTIIKIKVGFDPTMLQQFQKIAREALGIAG